MAHRARSVRAGHIWVAGRTAGLDVSDGGSGGLLGGHAGELDAGGDAELPEDMPQVEGDGMGAQEDPAATWRLLRPWATRSVMVRSVSVRLPQPKADRS